MDNVNHLCQLVKKCQHRFDHLHNMLALAAVFDITTAQFHMGISSDGVVFQIVISDSDTKLSSILL